MQPALSSQRQGLLELLRSKGRRAGHEVIASTLRELGITHVFGIGGMPVDPLLGSCAKQGIRVIGARHQQGAVMMSLAHNYVSGGLRSVVIVSSGPAVTNCATGMLIGHDNRWPLLVIGGRRALAIPGGFQAFDGARFYAPISKAAWLVDSASQLAESLVRAAHTVMAGAPGPVYLDVSDEALAEHVPYQPAAAYTRSSSELPAVAPLIEPDATGMADAISALATAQRPAMLIGKGARWSQPSALLQRLADDHAIAFATSPMGRGLLPDDHPLCFSAVRGRMLSDADVVLVVGARLDWTFRFGSEISPHARVVHIDIDASEAASVLGRGIGLHGDASVVLQRLLAGLDSQAAARSAARDRAWLDELSARRAELNLRAVPAAELGLLPMSPYEWLAELGNALPDEALTVLDGNIVMTAAQRMLTVRHPVSRLGPGTNGCMGVGVPFAIGAKLARPDLPVVAIVGDFGFGLSAVELETAVRHRVPIVVVISNNEGAGGATRQPKFFPAGYPERVTRYGPGVRYDQTMASFGGRGVRVDGPGQLGAAISEAIASDAPTCIDVVTNENTALSAAI
jgi:thiamine pyrophosphate-dependent acetolactate synthase large subunit-like protein